MNCKVRCTRGEIQFKTGKIYEVKNGIITPEKGWVPVFISVEDFNKKMLSKFELVEEEKMFTKDDLKVGYVVEDSNKRLTMVADSDDGKYLFERVVKIDDLNDDFKNKTRCLIFINKVYGFPENKNNFLKITIDGRPLLWERKEEPLEISIDEIAKWKGVPSDRIRIKE